MIPLIVLPGNHDILDSDAELYHTLFPGDQRRLYSTLDFGKYLSLFLLDTDYVDTIESQISFLEKTQKRCEDTFYRFAVDHEAA